MSTIAYNNATFLTSTATLGQLPADTGIEVAFAGRSNAGKSSALNALAQQKSLAKTSKTPGRTQLINLFRLDASRRLVDLPGYGYAKVSLAIKQRWQHTLQDYLQQRECLQGLILLMDIRHPLKEFDVRMIDWACASQLNTHILLTKADKLGRNQTVQTLYKVRHALQNYGDLISLQAFSATKKQGLEELKARLDAWFAHH